MLFNRKIGLVLFLFLFSSYREAEYCRICDRIVARFGKEFAEPKGLHMYGTGGAMADDIKRVFVDFETSAALDIDQASALYVEVMEELLRRINADRQVRPYLHNYPFEESNIKLMMTFRGSEQNRIGEGLVAMMSITRNHIIRFSVYDPEKKECYDLGTMHYEEAREKFKNRKGAVNDL